MLTDPPVTPPAPDDPLATPPATVLDKPTGLVKPDGSFIDDWYNSDSLPDGVKGAESLKVIKSVADLAKRTVNAEKMVGKKGIVMPGENATEAEWGEFYTAIGRPTTPDKYEADIPEDMTSLFDDTRMQSLRDRAFKLGVTGEQFKEFIAGEVEEASRILSEQDQEAARVRDEAELGLKREWGNAYDEKIHIVKRLIADTFGNSETDRLEFLSTYGNDPTFIRFAAAVGSRLVEHKALVAELTQETPTQALSRIKELEATPGTSRWTVRR